MSTILSPWISRQLNLAALSMPPAPCSIKPHLDGWNLSNWLGTTRQGVVSNWKLMQGQVSTFIVLPQPLPQFACGWVVLTVLPSWLGQPASKAAATTVDVPGVSVMVRALGTGTTIFASAALRKCWSVPGLANKVKQVTWNKI